MPRSARPKARRRAPKRRTPAPYAVVHLTAEYWPFARTGGLAEAVRGLATFQVAEGASCSIVLPLYRCAREAAADLEPAGPPFTIALGDQREEGRLWRPASGDAGPRVYFVEHEQFFDREGIYGEAGADYPDNAQRFAFLCRAALEALPDMEAAPLVLHAHDWHTALAPVYLRTTLAGQPFYDRVASVLSVHNAGFQGHFPVESLAMVGLPGDLYEWQRMEWYGRVNWLKGGLVFADMSVTVSPTHAHELRTPSGGFGLHDTFIASKDRLVGIINGIDTGIWNPTTDGDITARYSLDDLSGKGRCKAALQQELQLPLRDRTPVFGMTARLVAQKGLDLVLGATALTALDAQFIFLGQGEQRYEQALRGLADAMPERIAVEFDFSEPLEHRVIAGSDLLMMPSLYEPCGLTQMRAQRYGAIPVARRVGGLADTIEDGVTGFLFDEYTPAGFDVAARRAVDQYADRPAWELIMREAMQREFGWARSVARYVEVYRRALAARGLAD